MHTRLSPLLATLLFVTGLASAADGDFDPTFGDNGVALAGPDFYGWPAAVVQPDGKILACLAGWSNSQADFGIVRFNADGSLDTSFSSDGGGMLDFGNSDVCAALALQPDGRIVVAGFTTIGDPAWGYGDFAVARLHADGSPDTSFGAGTGRTVLPFDENSTGAAGLAIQADGKIVMVGEVGSDAVVVRLHADGSRDDAFGNDGVLAVFSGYVYDIAVDGENRIVVAGGTYINGVGNQFVAVRLLPTGEFDPDFDSDGQTTVGFGLGIHGSSAHALALQRDGRIAMAGYVDSALSGDPNRDMAVVRLLPNGSPDAAFGTGGKAVVPFDLASNGYDYANSIVWQSDGKLVIGGVATHGNGMNADPVHGAVARLNADGSLDERFGESGKHAFGLGTAPLTNTQISGLALQGTQVIGVGQTSLMESTFASFAVRFSIDLVFANGFE